MTLRTRLTREFGAKAYPNPKDPEILAKIENGMREFEVGYLGQTYPWILDGEFIYASAVGCFETRDPNEPNVVIGRFPNFDSSHMRLESYLPRIRDAGRQFFKDTTWQLRIQLLLKISEVAKRRFWLLCASKAYEQGQSRGEQIGETDEVVDFPLATAMYLEELHADKLLPTPSFAGEVNGRRYLPHGVFLDIEPFNFPGAIPMDMMTKALAMGNAVISKPSPKSALTGYLIFETVKIAFEEMGIPWQGVINFAPGGADVVDAMLVDPNISGISFTGSTSVLNEVRAKHGTMLRNGWAGTKAPLVIGSAETSGVNPFVVARDADPAYAAGEYVKAVVGRQGQKCSSARIAFVHNSHYFDLFASALCEKMDALVYGDVKCGADIGAMATDHDRSVVEHKVASALSTQDGHSTLLYQKEGCIGPGANFPPTIMLARPEALASAKHAYEIMNTEYFGPVSTVIRYRNINEVLMLLALSEFALTAAFFTENSETFLAMLDCMPTGNLYWNRKCTGALVDSECFGGLRSASSPVGIKGKSALSLFASQQTFSGFYPKHASRIEKHEFVSLLELKGFVLSKM